MLFKFLLISKKTFQILKSKLHTLIKPYKGLKKYDLIVFDDVFPYEGSLFRFIEYNYYLENFKEIKFICSGSSLPIFNSNKTLDQIFQEYIQSKNFKKNGVLEKFEGHVNIRTKLFYCIFLNNIFSVIDYLDYYNIPFVFTLYPGGGFSLYDQSSDNKLRKVLGSPNFKKVIVTQKITYNYLLDNRFCSNSKVEYIYGVVCNTEKSSGFKKNTWLIDKKSFDVCFIAGKYSPRGVDKGYDTFIEVAKELYKINKFINFHIVGGFDENDIDVSELGNNIQFHRYLVSNSLNKLFQNIDLVLSPNLPFKLNPGSFDGFPLGSCLEAALSGVAIMACDELDQNDGFINNQEIIIVKPNVSYIVKKIIYYINNYEELLILSEKGRQKANKLYSAESQLKTRVKILNEFIK